MPTSLLTSFFITPYQIHNLMLIFVLIWYILLIKSPSHLKKQRLYSLLLFELITIGLIIYPFPYRRPIQLINYYKDEIPIYATGSMFPTFPKAIDDEHRYDIATKAPMYPFPRQQTYRNQTLVQNELKHFDIISFYNTKTFEITSQNNNPGSGFAKRVIGLPGDTIEIRDGLVILNQKPLLEPYTANPRSTFGGEFLHECQPIIIPSDKVFVLGDNRKGSLDSRDELGLVNIIDIDHFLPFEEQLPLYQHLWRDPQQDTSDSSRIKIDKNVFVNQINNIKPTRTNQLILNPKLTQIATNRAQSMLKFNDLSFEATKSGQTQAFFISQSNFPASQWGEITYQGYYTAEELIERITQSPDNQEFFQSSDFSQIGIGVVQGSINNCPTQLITIHLTGYTPPNYSKEIIESWNRALENLESNKNNFNEIQQNPQIYSNLNQKALQKYLEILTERIRRIKLITSKLNNNQYLTPIEQTYIKEDQSLAEQLNDLAKQI